jgi:cellulose synthase/poly-beta-1,6-N-acetylglucosamine synthase-like glycosyltransferase
MTTLLTTIILLAFLPLAVCWSLWLLFTILAIAPARQIENRKLTIENPLQIDILIPAHNEELLLPALLESLANQSYAGQSRLSAILVVADHCSDSTARIARQFGVRVLERTTGPRGKPAALRDGLDLLNQKSKIENRKSETALVILDADCTVSSNFLEQCAAALDAGHKVLQSAYILTPYPIHHSLFTIHHSPSTLAFAFKNLIRPRGMARLHVPTQLFGTGMCFHPDILPMLTFEDHLIEDLALSHKLLVQNTPPVFLHAALVCSPLPTDTAALSTQKLRWETGQVHTWKKLPALLMKLALRGKFLSILSLLDWSAPPLAMALLVWFFLALIAFILALLHLVPIWILLAPVLTLSCLILYIVIGTLQFAGPSALAHLSLSVPKFFLWKLALYTRMLTGHAPTSWQKTPRTPTTEVHP